MEIRSILNTVMGAGLRGTLLSQLREYDTMETEALTIALQRGWDLKDLPPGNRLFLSRKTRFLVRRRNTDSSIAEVMIKKNTKAMISNLKSLHRSQCRDSQVAILSQKILDCGNAHIQQFQHYL